MKKIATLMFVAFAAFGLANGAANAAKVSPQEVAGASTIDASEAKKLFDQGVVFVDVRKDSDWEAGRIPNARHIELKKVLSEDTLGKAAKKDQAVVIYCNGPSCKRSSKACVKAVAWGYSKVYYFREGFPAWNAAGYSVE